MVVAVTTCLTDPVISRRCRGVGRDGRDKYARDVIVYVLCNWASLACPRVPEEQKGPAIY